MDEKTNNKKSRIEQLPESTRKKILIGSISTITLFLLVGWLISFPSSINLDRGGESEDNQISQIFEKARESLSQIDEELGELKEVNELLQQSATTSEEISETTTASTSQELSDEEVAKLREKIIELQNKQEN